MVAVVAVVLVTGFEEKEDSDMTMDDDVLQHNWLSPEGRDQLSTLQGI